MKSTGPETLLLYCSIYVTFIHLYYSVGWGFNHKWHHFTIICSLIDLLKSSKFFEIVNFNAYKLWTLPCITLSPYKKEEIHDTRMAEGKICINMFHYLFSFSAHVFITVECYSVRKWIFPPLFFFVFFSYFLFHLEILLLLVAIYIDRFFFELDIAFVLLLFLISSIHKTYFCFLHKNCSFFLWDFDDIKAIAIVDTVIWSSTFLRGRGGGELLNCCRGKLK